MALSVTGTTAVSHSHQQVAGEAAFTRTAELRRAGAVCMWGWGVCLWEGGVCIGGVCATLVYVLMSS